MKKGYVLLGMALLAAVFTSCDFYVRRSSSKGQRVRVVNKDVVVQSFEKVQIAGSFDVTYRQGDSCTVRIEAPQDAMKEIDIYTDGETLYIGPKRKNLLFSLKSLNQHHKIYVYATSPDLTSAEIAGSGEFDVNGHLDTDRLELSIAGSADMKLEDLICDELDATIAGSGDIKIKKMVAGKAEFSIAGSGDIEAKDIDCGAGLSACAAADSVLNLFWTIPYGILAVSRMLMSVNIGEEDRQSLTDTMRVSLFKCIPLMCCVSAVLMALAVPLTRLFFRDPADPVFQMTAAAFRIVPLSMPLSIILLQFSCYAQASGKQFLIHLLSALDGVVCMVCFSALLLPLLGINGFYLAYILNGLTCAAAIVSYAWIKRKKFPRNMEQLMMIPDDFGVAKSDRMDISVRRKNDVMSVSKQVMDYCRSRGLDEMRAYLSGLFLEEMAGNVVDHGFNKDKKSHSVDIRVIFKNDDVILRIKDDCIPFNPAEWQDIHDPRDRLKGVGIRMVYLGAKDVKYQNILGLNVLMIRI